MEQKIAELEKRVAELEKKAAAATDVSNIIINEFKLRLKDLNQSF